MRSGSISFPLGLFGISLATAIFPEMSVDAAKRDFDSLRRTISRGLRCTIFVALPATVGLLLISRPVVAIILERGEFTRADTAPDRRHALVLRAGSDGLLSPSRS